jgi:hypothetical protein
MDYAAVTFPVAAQLAQDRMAVPLAPAPRESADVTHRVAIGDAFSGRLVADVGYRPAPDPPRQGATATRRSRFWRQWTLTWPYHEQDWLLGRLVPRNRGAQAPRGRQAAWADRTNIYRAPYVTYSEALDAGAPGLTY